MLINQEREELLAEEQWSSSEFSSGSSKRSVSEDADDGPQDDIIDGANLLNPQTIKTKSFSSQEAKDALLFASGAQIEQSKQDEPE